MFDPEDDDQDRPEVDWDAWEKNRFTGYNRIWFISMALITAALVIRFFQSNGHPFP